MARYWCGFLRISVVGIEGPNRSKYISRADALHDEFDICAIVNEHGVTGDEHADGSRDSRQPIALSNYGVGFDSC